MENQRVAIITAASRGIGAGCARELALHGYRVALMVRSASVLELAQELDGIAIQGSLTEVDDLRRLVDITLTQFGRIDVVVNSFGDPPRPDLLEISDQLWLKNSKLLFLSVVGLARFGTVPLKQRGGGVIINISACDSQEPSLATPF